MLLKGSTHANCSQCGAGFLPPCPGRVEDGRGSFGPMASTPFPITGSPEAVTRPRFPQNVACGFPAPRSSTVDLQHRECLHLPVRETQFGSQQRRPLFDLVEGGPGEVSVGRTCKAQPAQIPACAASAPGSSVGFWRRSGDKALDVVPGCKLCVRPVCTAPGDAPCLVGDGDCDDFGRFLYKQLRDPGILPWMQSSLAHDGRRSDNEQAPEISISLL